MLAGLLRCHECRTNLWAQKQGTGGETCYKSPNKGLKLCCRFVGRSFLGRKFHAQTDELFKGFRLRDDWKAWVIENYVQKSSPESALRERRAVQAKVERVKHLYINDRPQPMFLELLVSASRKLQPGFMAPVTQPPGIVGADEPPV